MEILNISVIYLNSIKYSKRKKIIIANGYKISTSRFLKYYTNYQDIMGDKKEGNIKKFH